MTGSRLLRRATTAAAAVLITTASTGALASTAGAAPALPSSMASTGDSITRAYDVDSSHFLSDSPQWSWSTGTDAKVNSQYQRIVAANPAMSGHAFNDAKTGAKMTALDGQVKSAASQKVQYLTVLMGANDLCTSSASTMTSTSTFKAQFQQAMADFTAADPTAVIFVSSIPNIYQLWSLLHTNASAQNTWSFYGICQSMLSRSGTDATRQKVVDQEAADNDALATVCAQYSQCKWDGYATFNTKFTSSDVSTADYFHPSISGQNKLASTSWAASYWPSVK